MKTLAMIIVVLTLTSCSKTFEWGDFEWDPKTAMMRITFGVSK